MLIAMKTAAIPSGDPNAAAASPPPRESTTTLRLNPLFQAPAGSTATALQSQQNYSYSSRSATGETDSLKPLKGILVNQGKSLTGTPVASPRNVQMDIGPAYPDVKTASYPPVKVLGPSQKRNTSSSAMADFLKKFSPKLSRSKKSLQWYTVDIQPTSHEPSSLNHNSGHSPQQPIDPAVKALQNGRISSEFSSEMSECIFKNQYGTSALPSSTTGTVSVPRELVDNYPTSSRATAAQLKRRQFFPNSGVPPGLDKEEVGGTKSMPTTPVAQNHNQPWKMMMVDIDIDKPVVMSSANNNHGKGKGRMPTPQCDYPWLDGKAAPPLQSSVSDRVPSYIRLSRALNGYSARNLYVSKKPVNRGDYNVMLCKSEEFLYRATTPTPITHSLSKDGAGTLPLSARPSKAPSASSTNQVDFRRAASEDRSSFSARKPSQSARHQMIVEATFEGPPPSPRAESQVKPGVGFLQKLDKETEKLRELCENGQRELATEMPDEAMEQLRSAVGKTNLLLSQKFQQFRKLCEKNMSETENEPLKTTVSDLQGFWDMMLIQVYDVQRMFTEVERLRSPSWKKERIDSLNGSGGSSSVDHSATAPLSARNTQPPQSLLKATGSPRRNSKPKVTFQLNERDAQRKEMIAAKRRAFEEQKQEQNGADLPDVSVASNFAAAGENSDVQIFMPTAQVQ